MKRRSRRSASERPLDEDNGTATAEPPASPEGADLLRHCASAVRRLGIPSMYPEQERTVAAALAGQDVLVVLPTGFGKSVCYQVPSMVLPRPVVLVSPLLALLRDQHEKLLARDIPVARIDGTIRGPARRAALKQVAAGGSLLVMTTPETLAGDELGDVLRAAGIALAAVDEAHCISEWGHDFRPAYLRLGERLRELGAPPVLALTATATQGVRDDIVRYLGMRSPVIVASSPHRANLAFEVMEIAGDQRLRALTRFVKRLRRPGIIYCATTKAVDDLYGALRLLRMPAHHYHGRMSAKERTAEQELYMRPARTIMVATSAFGLGIDKPDIRYIVHYQSPASLEQYVQEAGRAGRDGRQANCVLLYDSKDRDIHEALLQTSRVRPDQLYRLAAALAAWAAEERVASTGALAVAAQVSERQALALVTVLEEAGLVNAEDQDAIRVTVPAAEFEELARGLAGRFVTLRTQDGRRLDRLSEYVHTTECRANFLQRYFGEEASRPCGLCDICRGAPQRPSSFWQPIARPPVRKQRRRRRRRRGRGQAQGQPRAASPEPTSGGSSEEPSS